MGPSPWVTERVLARAVTPAEASIHVVQFVACTTCSSSCRVLFSLLFISFPLDVTHNAKFLSGELGWSPHGPTGGPTGVISQKCTAHTSGGSWVEQEFKCTWSRSESNIANFAVHSTSYWWRVNEAGWWFQFAGMWWHIL